MASQSQRSLFSSRLAIRAAVIAAAGLLLGFGVTACCKNQKPPGNPAVMATPAALEQPPADRPSTKEACDGCSGKWGRHGLADVESCICKTKDAGKVCKDAAECVGQCLADEDGFEVVQAGPPPKGYWKGKCSEYDTTFGCNRIIGAGARAKGPQLAEDAADSLCID